MTLVRITSFILTLAILLLVRVTAAQDQPPGNFQPFDRWYGELAPEEKMAHLDNFAIELKRDPRLLGYILVFSGKLSCRGAAEARGNQFKRYLVETGGIAAERIIVKDGGYADVQTFVLLPSPPGARSADWPYYQPPSKEHVVEECKPHEILWPVFDTKLKIAPDAFITLPAGYHAYVGPIGDEGPMGLVGHDEMRNLFVWLVQRYERPFADPKSFAWIRTEGEGPDAIKYGLKVTTQGKRLVATKGVFILDGSVYRDEQVDFLLKVWRTLQSGPCRECVEPTPIEIPPKP